MDNELVERDAAPELRRHIQRYYDQAHMDRDFREFAGTTPSAYADDPRDRVTFVQDEAA